MDPMINQSVAVAFVYRTAMIGVKNQDQTVAGEVLLGLDLALELGHRRVVADLNEEKRSRQILHHHSHRQCCVKFNEIKAMIFD